MQKIPKHCYDIGWGGTSGFMSLNGGDYASFATFGANSTRIPVSCAGTLSNFSVIADAAANPTCTFTIAVNGVATALAVILPSGSVVPVTDTSHSVSVSAGDDVSILITGANDGSHSGDAGFCIDFTPSDGTLSSYGISAMSGSISGGDAWIGGAFGNGAWQTNAVTNANSNTYSISCLTGTITRIDLKSMRGTFGGGNTFTAYILLNGVLQDGTGVTVNTATTLDGASTSASGTFSLPVSPADKVDIYMVYAGSTLTFANASIAASCLFQSSSPNTFHWCGGNNNVMSTSVPSYRWMGANQNTESVEATAQTPVGPSGFTATALYVIHESPGHNASATFTDTLRINGSDTAQTTTVQQLQNGDNSGTSSVSVILSPNDLINLISTPANTPNGAQFHWGVAVSSTVPSPTPSPTQSVTPTDKKQWVLYRFDLKPREEQTA